MLRKYGARDRRNTFSEFRRIQNKSIQPKFPCVKLEEEEAEGCSYEELTTEEEARIWWEAFRRKYNYPLYCIIMATSLDKNVATVVEEHRDELSKIAGQKCCFVYFRDLERARQLFPFNFKEHEKGVMKLIDIIDLERNSLPCLLFFENLTANDYASVGIDSGEPSSLIKNIRDVFTYIHAHQDVSMATERANGVKPTHLTK